MIRAFDVRPGALAICYCRPDNDFTCGHCALDAVIAETLAIPLERIRAAMRPSRAGGPGRPRRGPERGAYQWRYDPATGRNVRVPRV